MNALSGSLDLFTPVQILRLLQSTRATGRLEIRRGDERADLFLVDGRSAFALTNVVHVRVGDVLVDGGEIRPEAIELVAAFQQDRPGSPIGRLLVESGAIGPEQLRAAVLEVQRRIMCRVLMWHQGEFAFYPCERADDEDIMLDLDVDRLIVEALRIASEADEGGLLKRAA